MKNKWTIETAKRCLAKATKGQLSLTEAGACDFLRNKGFIGQPMGVDDESVAQPEE